MRIVKVILTFNFVVFVNGQNDIGVHDSLRKVADQENGVQSQIRQNQPYQHARNLSNPEYEFQDQDPQQKAHERVTIVNNMPIITVPEIAVSAKCKADVARICSDRAVFTNLEAVLCMTERVQKDDDLTDECHEYLWDYKVNVAKDPKMINVATEVCKQAYLVHPEWGCKSINDGKFIPCLLDHKNEIYHRPCYHFLVKIGTIIFSDYHLIYDFVENCRDDIYRQHCARFSPEDLNNKTGKTHSSQGAVIKCLEEAITDGDDVSEKCVRQIMRLSELSSDDFHLDRNLYFACKSDRDALCEEVASGEGRIYHCLIQHKFDAEMTTQCQEALTLRQRLVAQDYKASYALQQACKRDIAKLNCMAHPEYKSLGMNDYSDVVGISGMLMCIEQAKLSHRPMTTSLDCDSSLVEFRRMLIDDYKMSPEIVQSCKHEITGSCNRNGLVKKGATIHCLMRLALRDTKRMRNEEPHLGDECSEAMFHLLRENRAASDYKMDRVLVTACGPIASALCQHHQKGDPSVLSCLVENINSKGMSDTCRQRLLELQYFIARDFSLDVNFHKKCHKDAKKIL